MIIIYFTLIVVSIVVMFVTIGRVLYILELKRGLVIIGILSLTVLCISILLFASEYNRVTYSNFKDTDNILSLNIEGEVSTNETKPFRIMDIATDENGKCYVKGIYEKKRYIVNIDRELYNIISDYSSRHDLNNKVLKYELNMLLVGKEFYIDDLTYTKYIDKEPIKIPKKEDSEG